MVRCNRISKSETLFCQNILEPAYLRQGLMMPSPCQGDSAILGMNFAYVIEVQYVPIWTNCMCSHNIHLYIYI